MTQYAHFTPEFIVRAMWKALRRMGFSEGRVLEPGCGSGLFFSLLPEALADKTTLTGVELDPITARITKLLFPNAQIRNEDFTKARLPTTSISRSAIRPSATAQCEATTPPARSLFPCMTISSRARSNACAPAVSPPS